MNRPYIFCHMFTSLDGKILGPYMDTPESDTSGEVFDEISFGKNAYYDQQGWLSGRTTTDDNFTHYKKPMLETDFPTVPAGDFVAETDLSMYYISIDASGRIGWESNVLTYQDTKTHVIEVLSEKVGDDYKHFLRQLNISYIIAGENTIDPVLAVNKLQELFGMKTIMLGGGGVLNWSFIQAGMCDELSLVITPVADGSSTSPSIFEAKEGLSKASPVTFTLASTTTYQDGTLWLRYLVNHK